MPSNDDFMASIDNATLQIVQEQVQRTKKACLLVEREAKKNVPVDMGTLRASITSDVSFDSLLITGRVFSNLDYAPYAHEGTGIYAKDGNGRMTPWVYVKGSQGGAKKGQSKGYSWEKALQVMAILQKKGLDAHATKGQKPKPFLEDAKMQNKGKIERMLAGK